MAATRQAEVKGGVGPGAPLCVLDSLNFAFLASGTTVKSDTVT